MASSGGQFRESQVRKSRKKRKQRKKQKRSEKRRIKRRNRRKGRQWRLRKWQRNGKFGMRKKRQK